MVAILSASARYRSYFFGTWRAAYLAILSGALVLLIASNTRAHELKHFYADAPIKLPLGMHATLQVRRHRHTVSLEWVISAWGLLGFENLPSTPIEHRLWDQNLNLLYKAEVLWHFNQEAGCKPLEAIVTSPRLAHFTTAQPTLDKMFGNRPPDLSASLIPSLGLRGAPNTSGNFFRGYYTFRCLDMT